MPARDVEPIDVPPSTLSQPIPVDTNGEMKLDLLGTSPTHGSSGLHVWRNRWNASQPQSPLFEMYVIVFIAHKFLTKSFDRTETAFRGADCKLANPHSNAVIDLDGDCLAGKYTPTSPSAKCFSSCG